jgi:hypothetical protein
MFGVRGDADGPKKNEMVALKSRCRLVECHGVRRGTSMEIMERPTTQQRQPKPQWEAPRMTVVGHVTEIVRQARGSLPDPSGLPGGLPNPSGLPGLPGLP